MAEPLPRTAPAAVRGAPTDHNPTPEWDTSVFYDLCGTCGWPVSKAPAASEWTHDVTNPSHWTDKRATHA